MPTAKANACEVSGNGDIARKKKRKLAEGKRASMSAHALAIYVGVHYTKHR